jgi:RHS repeat-associated protein
MRHGYASHVSSGRNLAWGLSLRNCYERQLKKICGPRSNARRTIKRGGEFHDTDYMPPPLGDETADTFHLVDPEAGASTGNNDTLLLSTVESLGARGELLGMTNKAGAHELDHIYDVDTLYRRTKATREDGTQWRYGYDTRNQVTSGAKYVSATTAAATAVVGHRFTYAYDLIGNRTSDVVYPTGTTTNPASQVSRTFSSNTLNQFTYQMISGHAIVRGETTASGTPFLNGTQIPSANFTTFGTAPNDQRLFWGSATRYGYTPFAPVKLKNATADTTNATPWLDQGYVYAPASISSITYDHDGNLLSDGRWTYRWDCENRLISVQSAGSQIVVGTITQNIPSLYITFSYDGRSRRIGKVVRTAAHNASPYSPSPMTWPVTLDERYVYDGWNLVARLKDGNPTLAGFQPALVQTYVWGPDLSGTMDEAGGVGGLLQIKDWEVNKTWAPCYDGNGNILSLIRLDQTTPNALTICEGRYEYDPFGNLLRVTGEAAERTPFRFSTKYTDHETGLVYYGYRYFKPDWGKWINRDPIGERGGKNLFAVVDNSALNLFDLLGLAHPDSRHWPADCSELGDAKKLRENVRKLYTDKKKGLKGGYRDHYQSMCMNAKKTMKLIESCAGPWTEEQQAAMDSVKFTIKLYCSRPYPDYSPPRGGGPKPGGSKPGGGEPPPSPPSPPPPTKPIPWWFRIPMPPLPLFLLPPGYDWGLPRDFNDPIIA